MTASAPIPPTLQGPRGRAWNLKPPPESPACLGAFLVHAPGFHPFWGWYLLSVVHLRPVDGVPATKHFQAAEYEIVVQALDPGLSPSNPVDVLPAFPLVDPTGHPVRPLTPPNVVEQFPRVDHPPHNPDEVAKAILTELTGATVRGVLSPDSDYRRAWTIAVKRLVQRWTSTAKADA